MCYTDPMVGLFITRFITTGSSKGGMAALIACGGDPRIVGSYPTAWNSGNLPEFTRLKGERWGWNVKPKETGPAGMTDAEVMKSLGTRRSEEYCRLFDPYQFRDLLAGKFVMPAVGTNDPLFHLLSDQFYYDDLACKKAFLRVPNYPHGRASTQHAEAWRFAVAAALLDRSVPTVKLESRPDGDAFKVFASISNAGQVKRLAIHSTRSSTLSMYVTDCDSPPAEIPNHVSEENSRCRNGTTNDSFSPSPFVIATLILWLPPPPNSKESATWCHAPFRALTRFPLTLKPS